MSELKTQSGDKLEIGAVSEELLEKYNRPGPRYTSYPTAPVWKDDFGPGESRRILRAGGRACDAAIAVHASSLLREPLSFLRVQRIDPEGQERRGSLPCVAQKRNRARSGPGLQEAAGDSIPLGRRHADLPDACADGRAISSTHARGFRSRRMPRSESKWTRG